MREREYKLDNITNNTGHDANHTKQKTGGTEGTTKQLPP